MASSDSVDISKVLSQLGVNPEQAKNLQNKMNGIDYLNLANAIGDDSPKAQAEAKQILTKYGIKLAKVPQMDNTRLESIYSGIRQGKAFEEATLTEHVRPISEMNSPAAAMSGYSSFVRAANDTDAEMLRDWLDENEVDYQNNDKHTFLVQSADREATYRLNQYMGKMNGKTSVMDGEEIDEAKKPEFINTMIDRMVFSGGRLNYKPLAQDEKLKRLFTRGFRAGFANSWPSDAGVSNDDWAVVEQGVEAGKVARKNVGEKNIPPLQVDARYGTKKMNPAFAKAADAAMKQMTDESIEESKMKKNDKIPASTPRNPYATHAAKKSSAGAHNSKDPSKRDAWDRNAKHKKSFANESLEESSFAQGQVVKFGENEVPVHIPAGPNGTIGVLVDGKVKMVREGDITRTDEGIMGMTKIDPLYRLRELAGIRGGAPIQEDDFGTVDSPLEVADDFDGVDDMGADGDINAMTSSMDDTGALGADLGSDAEFAGDPLGGDLDGLDADPLAGPEAGVPGDLPPMGADGAIGGMSVEPPQSVAYSEILDHLNNIQNSLGDVKLSEYRSLVAKLEDLAVQIKGMGRDYLGEMRKLKK